MHPLLEGALFAGALPAALTAGLVAGTLALSKSGTACRWRGGIAVALPFLVSGLALGKSGGALDWLPYLALAGALVPRLNGWTARPFVSLALRLLLTGAGCAVLAYNKLRFAWEWDQAAFTVGSLALAWLVVSHFVEEIPSRARTHSPRGELPGLLGIAAACGASAPVWGIAGSLSLAQASGTLASIAGTLAVFVWFRPQAQVPRATVPTIAYLWGATAVGGSLLVYELPLWVPLGFAAVPACGALLASARFRRLPLAVATPLAVVVCAAPLGSAVGVLSLPEPEPEVVEDDPYAGYENWTPSGE